MTIKRAFFLALLSLSSFFLAAIYITYPLIFHMTDAATGTGDELVIAWIQNWVIHGLLTNPLGVFQANLYYPYHNTLAFTETFMLTSVLAIPIRLLTGEPIATVNFTFLSSLVLLGFSMYLLCFYLTRNFPVSVFTGHMVIFSPAVLDYTVHLQVLSMWSVPLALLFFLHFLKTRMSLFLGLSLLFFVMQLYNSIMPGYFIVFSYIILLLFHTKLKLKKLKGYVSKRNVLLVLGAFALILPIAVPYFSVSYEFKYVRDIRDAVHFAMQPEDLVYPGVRTRLHDTLIQTIPTNQYSQNNEFKPGYLGVVFSALVLVALIYVIRNFRKTGIDIKSFLTISVVGFILSLGPVLHLARHTVHYPFLIPLPYAVLYYVLPGFQGLRNSARFNMLFMLCMAVVIALVLHKILSKYSFRRQVVVCLLLFAGVVAELSFPLKLYPVPQTKDFPPVYHWLATTSPETRIIELPIYNWNMQPFTKQEMYREYYGTLHFRRTVNGSTGFSPPPWQTFISDVDIGFPSKDMVKRLKQMGITYVIVHADEYTALSKSSLFSKGSIKDGKTIIEKARSNPDLRFDRKFGETYVFRL